MLQVSAFQFLVLCAMNGCQGSMGIVYIVKKVCIIELILIAMVWEDTMAIYLVSSHPASLPLVIQTKLHT